MASATSLADEDSGDELMEQKETGLSKEAILTGTAFGEFIQSRSVIRGSLGSSGATTNGGSLGSPFVPCQGIRMRTLTCLLILQGSPLQTRILSPPEECPVRF